MKAVAYCRVSTSDQVEGFSISAQVRAIRAHCESQGWELVREYLDEGVSAARESAAQRPAFRELLADVERGGIDVVVVHKLDRFSRNVAVTTQSLARLQKAHVGFVSLSEHIDYTTPQGLLTLGLFGLLAEFYSNNLATEVSKGRRERAAQGLWNGDLPFGYVSTGDARRAPEVLPAEAKLVEHAFRLYAGGTTSAHEVAEWMNEQGARPRSKRGLTRFTKATVIDMLSNPFFSGRVRYRGEVMPGAHEAIVSEALFEAVERMRASRRRMPSALRRHPVRVYLLRGLARCVSCGETLWCHPGSNGDRYRDASKLKQRECGARRTSVDVRAIDEQIGRLVGRMVLPADWQRIASEYATANSSAVSSAARRARIRERLARAHEMYLEGDMPRSRYDAEKARLRAEVDALDAAENVVTPMDEAAELLGRLSGAWEAASVEQRATLTATVFADVWVDLDEGRVEYVRPRSQFQRLFEVLRAEKVVFGDPERARVNHAQLYAPMLALVEVGALYAPGDIGSVAS